MTSENEAPRGSDKGSGAEQKSAIRKSRGFFFVLMFLLALIVVAIVMPTGPRGNVQMGDDLIVKLLHEGKLDPESIRFVEDRGHFIGTIRRSAQETKAGATTQFLLAPGTEAGIHDFKKEIARYNGEHPESPISPRVQSSNSEFWSTILHMFFLFLFILVLYVMFIRPMRGAGPAGGLFSFGKSRARMTRKGESGVTFEDVAGIDEAKSEVQEIIQFLKSPQKFLRLGGRIPRGVVLAGAPGTGKTLLAKAIAGEADVPFFSISGSDFVEMFVGVGASRVRDLFKQARESSPCIIFLDEIDAVGRRRGSGLGGGNDEREQTLNAILVEMDGFDSDAGIVMVAATNRPDILDPALLRPGRFDREIVIDLPDLKGREEILTVHSRRVTLADDVDLERIAQLTPTFSGAELAALVNEGAIIAAMKDDDAVRGEHLEEARDKIRFGRERSNRCFSDEDLKITAYHEAGHALVAHLLPEVEPLHKVTIIPRGMALGATMQIPERDRYHTTRTQLQGNLMVFYAGRIAEKMFCDDITAGATNDIERATGLARRMVCEWGMSDVIGPINYGENEETFLFGRGVSKGRNYGESLSQKIDDEIRRLIDSMYQKTEKLLRKHRVEIDKIATALLRKETLTGTEVAKLVGGEAIVFTPEGGEGSLVEGAVLEDGKLSE